MKRIVPFLLLSLGLALAACAQTPPAPTPVDTTPPPASESSYSSEAASSSMAPVVSETKTVTLVDQDFSPEATTGTGSEYLRVIATKELKGSGVIGKLHVHLSSGWMALGAYVAGVSTLQNGKDYPDESFMGTHLHFIDAVWSGSGERRLSKDSNMGALTQHATDFTYDLGSVPMTTGDNGSDTSSTSVDLLSKINNGGVFIGFAPSGYTGHVTVTLEYAGDLTVSPL